MDVLTPYLVPFGSGLAHRTIEVRVTRDGEQTAARKLVLMLDGNGQMQAVFSTDQLTSQVFVASDVDREWLFVARDGDDPPRGAAAVVAVDSDVTIALDLNEHERPEGGNGLLSGSFPLSLITQGGNLPSQANIRILYRPEQGASGDGYVVATTTCNADGTWQVSGLNENLKFDIVARIPGFNDVLISDVQPTGAPLSAYFAGIKEKFEYKEEVSIQVVALGGKPPYNYTVNTLPEGLTFNSNTGYITGSMPAVGLTISVTVTDAMLDSVTTTWEGTVDR